MAAVLCVVSAGCVTANQHEVVVAERDRLALEAKQLGARVNRLETSNQSLDQERIQLIEQTEDLREVRAVLEKNVNRLGRSEKELSANLAATRDRLAAQSEEVTRLTSTYTGLVEELEAEVSSGQIEIEQLRGGLRLNVSDEILFDSGSAELASAGQQVLSRVAARLVDIPQRVEVQGHTDDIPIRGALTKRYPTNWELAAARAARVVRLMQQRGVDPARLTAVSYAETRPVAPNDSAEERSRNRRIEIRLLPPEGGTDGAPAPAKAASKGPTSR